MLLNTEIVDLYLKGGNVFEYKNHWIFQAIGQEENMEVITGYEEEHKVIVKKLYGESVKCINQFMPYNVTTWDVIYPVWKEFLDNLEVYLVIGLPEPNDATVILSPLGKHVIVFDLGCWIKYYSKVDITELIRNLITHEISHICVRFIHPQINQALEQGEYLVQLNARIFNEGFAHFLSYNDMIGNTDWRSDVFKKAKQNSLIKLKQAAVEKDSKKQEVYLEESIEGDYYDKYGVMIGMLYLADIYMVYGKKGLAKELKKGYTDFIKRMIHYYEYND